MNLCRTGLSVATSHEGYFAPVPEAVCFFCIPSAGENELEGALAFMTYLKVSPQATGWLLCGWNAELDRHWIWSSAVLPVFLCTTEPKQLPVLATVYWYGRVYAGCKENGCWSIVTNYYPPLLKGLRENSSQHNVLLLLVNMEFYFEIKLAQKASYRVAQLVDGMCRLADPPYIINWTIRISAPKEKISNCYDCTRGGPLNPVGIWWVTCT